MLPSVRKIEELERDKAKLIKALGDLLGVAKMIKCPDKRQANGLSCACWDAEKVLKELSSP